MAPRKPLADSNPEVQEPGYRGTVWVVSSDALHSRTFAGRVEHGTYREAEFRKGAVDRRVRQLQQEGYLGIQVREVTPGGNE